MLLKTEESLFFLVLEQWGWKTGMDNDSFSRWLEAEWKKAGSKTETGESLSGMVMYFLLAQWVIS